MNTAKHTPGQPCTCCILLRTGEPLESRHGEQPCSDISRIELCPKHAAAPAMYEALAKLRLEAIHYRNTGVGVQFLNAALDQAEDAINLVYGVTK